MKLNIHHRNMTQFTVSYSLRKQYRGRSKNSQRLFVQMEANSSLFFIPWTLFLFFCMIFTGVYFSYQGFQTSISDDLSCDENNLLYLHACLCICVFVCFPGAWTFLWFVCFCLLASQWGKTHETGGIPMDAARATLAFSFFSIATWVRRLLKSCFMMEKLRV